MENKGEFFTLFIQMKPDIEKNLLPDGKEPVSAKEVKKQGWLATLRPKDPLPLDEIEFNTYRNDIAINDGMKNYRNVNREYKDRYKMGEKKAVIQLLERYPCFIDEPWVRKALKEKPIKPGRKWGHTRIKRSLIVSLVDALIKKGFSKERAFRILSGRISLGYDRIKALENEGRKNQTIAMPSKPPEDIKEMSKGILYGPEYIMEEATKLYGNEKARELMHLYIEENEKILNKEVEDDPLIQITKKILIKNRLIERAKSLLV